MTLGSEGAARVCLTVGNSRLLARGERCLQAACVDSWDSIRGVFVKALV